MQWAYNLRVFAIFMVVVIHVTAGYVTFADTNPSFYGSTLWWSANILDSFSRWSVPVFVMLSGYMITFLNYIGYFVIGGVFRAKKTEKLCMCAIFTLISLIITAILAYKFG